jgi:hypothetical protein
MALRSRSEIKTLPSCELSSSRSVRPRAGWTNVPSLARALGCRLSSDLRQITLFFSSSDGRELLGHIGLNGTIAAVFPVPSTHQALQLKGVDARVEKTGKNDLKFVSSYRQAFVDHVGKLGYPRELIETLLF